VALSWLQLSERVLAGRTTAEGEFIPCRSEQLDLDMIEGQLLLPLTIEHTIDERSPLCGHTYDTLQVRFRQGLQQGSWQQTVCQHKSHSSNTLHLL